MADDAIDVDVGGKEKPGGSSGMLIVTIIGLLVMLLTPLTSYFIVKMTIPDKPQVVAGDSPSQRVATDEPLVFNVDALLVNIAETKGTRILRVVPHLVMNDPKLLDRAEVMKPMIADRIMAVSSSRTIEELDGNEGRELLKKDILITVNDLLATYMEGAVVDVYFSEFLIQ